MTNSCQGYSVGSGQGLERHTGYGEPDVQADEMRTSLERVSESELSLPTTLQAWAARPLTLGQARNRSPSASAQGFLRGARGGKQRSGRGQLPGKLRREAVPPSTRATLAWAAGGPPAQAPTKQMPREGAPSEATQRKHSLPMSLPLHWKAQHWECFCADAVGENLAHPELHETPADITTEAASHGFTWEMDTFREGA